MPRVIVGDCVAAMQEMPENSVDAVVTDPPYGLAFMGKKWDVVHQGWHEAWAREALRVLKPGGHLIAAGGTRTYHRLTRAIEDAGFEIRDCIAWIYGSGFPKSKSMKDIGRPELGTALKPAHEPWVLARKPLSESSVARNVLAHGTGAINVDASRVQSSEIGSDARHSAAAGDIGGNGIYGGAQGQQYSDNPHPESARHHAQGRWPANLLLSHSEQCERRGVKRVKPSNGSGRVVSESKQSTINTYGEYGVRPGIAGFTHLDPDGFEEQEDWACVEDCPVRLLDEQSGVSKSTAHSRGVRGRHDPASPETFNPKAYSAGVRGQEDKGGASRFFKTFDSEATDTGAGFYYVAKASRSERTCGGTVECDHPTVKPIALMRYLVKMICPPNGTVLDPFMGSGSTGCAAILEGFDFIGIEQDEGYAEIAEKRIAYYREQAEDKLFA